MEALHKKIPGMTGDFFFQLITTITKPATQKSCEKRIPKVRGWLVMV